MNNTSNLLTVCFDFLSKLLLIQQIFLKTLYVSMSAYLLQSQKTALKEVEGGCFCPIPTPKGRICVHMHIVCFTEHQPVPLQKLRTTQEKDYDPILVTVKEPI